MADSQQHLVGGPPVNKPRPGDRHPEPLEPRPAPRPPVGAPPAPPAPPPPRPLPRPPVGNGPVIKPEPGGPRPEPLPPEVKIGGPIGALWQSLGGRSWGLPITRVQGIADGGRGGQEVRFMSSPSAPRKIVWTAKTGAQLIAGPMLLAWSRVRGGGGALGYPTSGTNATLPRGGTDQRFEFGTIVSHPQAGVHEVHGAIHERYVALRRSRYGFPTTDETPTSDGRGRFNHFRAPDGSECSIYWSPGNGAWEVYGPIRDLWAQQGWERGPLGYPTGDPKPTDVPGELGQTFTGGRITLDPSGAVADPMRWSQHFEGGGFSGNVTVTIASTGQVLVNGRAQCGPPAAFSYHVQPMVTATDGRAIVLPHKGKLQAFTSTDGDALPR